MIRSVLLILLFTILSIDQFEPGKLFASPGCRSLFDTYEDVSISITAQSLRVSLPRTVIKLSNTHRLDISAAKRNTLIIIGRENGLLPKDIPFLNEFPNTEHVVFLTVDPEKDKISRIRQTACHAIINIDEYGKISVYRKGSNPVGLISDQGPEGVPSKGLRLSLDSSVTQKLILDANTTLEIVGRYEKMYSEYNSSSPYLPIGRYYLFLPDILDFMGPVVSSSSMLGRIPESIRNRILSVDFGRSFSNSQYNIPLSPESLSISIKHFSIVEFNKKFYLITENARMPVFLNGRSVDYKQNAILLKDGDIVQIKEKRTKLLYEFYVLNPWEELGSGLIDAPLSLVERTRKDFPRMRDVESVINTRSKRGGNGVYTSENTLYAEYTYDEAATELAAETDPSNVRRRLRRKALDDLGSEGLFQVHSFDNNWIYFFSSFNEVMQYSYPGGIGRFFINLKTGAAEDFFSLLAVKLASSGYTTQHKMAVMPSVRSKRKDCFVLYFPPAASEYLLATLTEMIRQDAWTNEGIPAMTAQVLYEDKEPIPGLAFAQDPLSVHHSFGSGHAKALYNASSYTAEGLEARARGEEIDIGIIFDEYATNLHELGYDVFHPAFNRAMGGFPAGIEVFRPIYERTDQYSE
ncbi:MAG: FHA domain-containing protein [Pseudomonadota bacterium]